jgi:hypothetical protein
MEKTRGSYPATQNIERNTGLCMYALFISRIEEFDHSASPVWSPNFAKTSG